VNLPELKSLLPAPRPVAGGKADLPILHAAAGGLVQIKRMPPYYHSYADFDSRSRISSPPLRNLLSLVPAAAAKEPS